MTEDKHHMTEAQPANHDKEPYLTKKVLLHISYIFFVVFGCFVATIRKSRFIELDELIFRIFIGSLGILMLSYLVLPLFVLVARIFKNIKEKRSLLADDPALPPLKMSALYKFFLFIFGYEVFFGLVKLSLCEIYKSSCSSDGFGLHMVLFIAVVCLWGIYKSIQLMIYLAKNRSKIWANIKKDPRPTYGFIGIANLV